MNLKNDKPEHDYDFRVDRPSPVGNPFVGMAGVKDNQEREKVCDLYEDWFQLKLKKREDQKFIHYLHKIKEALLTHGRVRLFCWCAPKRCHSETIKRWLEKETQPWNLTKKEITIINAYEANIIGENDIAYVIEFLNNDGERIEACINKNKFSYLPHKVCVGSVFGIVTYKKNGSISASVWPVNTFWNTDLRE